MKCIYGWKKCFYKVKLLVFMAPSGVGVKLLQIVYMWSWRLLALKYWIQSVTDKSDLTAEDGSHLFLKRGNGPTLKPWTDVDSAYAPLSPLLLINGHPGVSALHDLRHGGEVEDGRAGQHEAVLQRSQDVLHRLGTQHPAAELLLHKLTARKTHIYSKHLVSLKEVLDLSKIKCEPSSDLIKFKCFTIFKDK